jgi:hypothetical protein
MYVYTGDAGRSPLTRSGSSLIDRVLVTESRREREREREREEKGSLRIKKMIQTSGEE